MTTKTLPAGELRQALGQLNIPEEEVTAVVDFLFRESLLDATHLRAWTAQRAVQRLLSKGYGKIAAMEVVAEQMALSFFTVRKYVYTTYK